MLANIFSYSVAHLFIILTVSLTEEKFLIFMKSSISIKSFTDHVFGVLSKIIVMMSSVQVFFFLCYLLGVSEFCILHRSLRHFELIFVKDVRSVSRFIILSCGFPSILTHLLKRLSLFHCISLTPLPKIS